MKMNGFSTLLNRSISLERQPLGKLGHVNSLQAVSKLTTINDTFL